MKNQIAGIVPFPTDCESNPFFAALASVLLPALGFTEETSFPCGRGGFCTKCGECKPTILQRYHLRMYHDYQTLTGVSFAWAWPELDTDYHAIENAGADWRWPDEFIGFIMGFAGLAWQRISKDAQNDNIYQAITASIAKGVPVLLKLGNGQDWHVVTGYRNGSLYALSYKKKERLLSKWHDVFEEAIVITGRCEPTATFADILRRIIAVLEHPTHTQLEADLNRRIDEITDENAQDTAVWLNAVASFPIEARWHAAESFTTGEDALYGMRRLTGDAAVKNLFGRIFLSYIGGEYEGNTHGVLWKVWGLLGIPSKKTGFAVPKNGGELVMKPEAQIELKRLFALVFKNDRDVLAVLKEALMLL